ncbi:unnamed protein product [marine sediment metagenome]|uniref:Uncharacterized protein n=1 Tax=marine sediment metagenome TaxID=412755 RepID=X1I2G9_9ZZZZ
MRRTILSDPHQRAAWDLYGASVLTQNKLGEQKNLTGFNHYLRSNLQVAARNKPIIDDGPLIYELPLKDTKFACAVDEATQSNSVTFDDAADWCKEDGSWFTVYQGHPQNTQRNFFDGPWRLSGVASGQSAIPITSPHDEGLAFPVGAGQKVWFYARITRADGRLSEPFRCDSIVS